MVENARGVQAGLAWHSDRRLHLIE
jgi:hypothetical protein